MALTIYKINIKYTVLSVAKYLLRIMFSSPVPGNFQSDFRFDSETVKVFCTNRNGRLKNTSELSHSLRQVSRGREGGRGSGVWGRWVGGRGENC